MLRDSINKFYESAARKFAKSGTIQLVETDTSIIKDVTVDREFIKSLMSKQGGSFRYVTVNGGHYETSDDRIHKLVDRKILMSGAFPTYVGEFYEDVLEKFGIKKSVINLDEEVAKLKAAAAAEKKENKERGVKGGIFNYEYFYNVNNFKCTLNEILSKNPGKKVVWYIGNAKDTWGSKRFSDAQKAAKFLGEEFNYVFVKTCQCVWDNNKKKFPDVESFINDIAHKYDEEYNKKLGSLENYTDVYSYTIKDLIAENGKAGVATLVKELGENHILTQYIKKIIDNARLMKSLPNIESIPRVELQDKPEFEAAIKKYEMIGSRLSDFASTVRYENSLAKVIRYVKLVDKATDGE